MSRTRVFVGGLTYRCTERDLEKFFRKYGRLKEIAMKTGFAFVEFDDYRDAEDAIYELNGKDLLGERVSVERARGTPRGSDQWRGNGRGYSAPRRRGSRERGGGGRFPPRREENSRGYGGSGGGGGGGDRYGPPTRTDYRVYVDNLSSRVSWQDLKDYMRQEGCEVTYADAHKEHRNEAVVEFATYNDMKTALEKLDGMELNGRKIRLVEDKKRRSRSSTRSRSRSKRRSRTRSRSRRSSRSKSKSKSKSRSRSRSRSRSAVKQSKSRSRSVSKHRNGKSSRSRSIDGTSKSRSRSVSKARNGRSRSRSPIKDSRSRSRSTSPTRNGD